MNDLPPNAQNPEENATNDAAQELLRKLRQKQGNWVEWGIAIASLLKSGYNPQEIFEATGFEPIQQNQVVVGSQVYNSLENSGVSAARDRTMLHAAVMCCTSCVCSPKKNVPPLLN